MGASFDWIKKNYDCGGQKVTNALDAVFKDSNGNQFKTAAQTAITYFQQAYASDNWKDLMAAYLIAGVDAGKEFPAWCSFLEDMSKNNKGYISQIAQERYTALQTSTGIQTTTHKKGNSVDIDTSGNPHVISSRC